MKIPNARSVVERAAKTFRSPPLAVTQDDFEDLKLLAAQPSIQWIKSAQPKSLREVELRVFSQFGDDGILQYLVHHLQLTRDTFVEFGVQNYRESNTRLLLTNDNWRGLVMDGSDKHIANIRSQTVSWRHELTALCAFITRDNINELLTSSGFAGRLGLLSVDIDGNDYWVWEAITAVDPVIVVAEYNSVFGSSRAVTVPYDATFTRTGAHFSNLYWGASIRALTMLAERKGYVLVGGNAAGNNLHFVKRELAGGLPRPTIAEAFVESRFRESRDQAGELTFVSGAKRRNVIGDLEVHDIETGGLVSVRSLGS